MIGVKNGLKVTMQSIHPSSKGLMDGVGGGIYGQFEDEGEDQAQWSKLAKQPHKTKKEKIKPNA
ncbi:hypothetical protein HPP92_006168 [Vanilla planifolia]|uniref:Uncharacterized protein n=1 Tax=Vanilla planifolia TaxID=51239 RepID=A0A835VC21_VANPL|nr:hypothetical protein HPP92_006168 [Vanilla planifolia]